MHRPRSKLSAIRTSCTAVFVLITPLAPLRAQDQDTPAPPPATRATAEQIDDALARFRALDLRRKANVLRQFERSLSWSENAAATRIGALRAEFDALPPAAETTPTYGDPVTDPEAPYRSAQGSIDRHPVAATAPDFAKVAARFHRVAFLPDLQREVDYEWATHRVVRRAALGYDELFANALHGYPPGADHAVARVLEALDRDPDEHARATFFAHTYADLSGKTYPGITLYDAWYSGRPVDVPDVDAVPFGWLVLREKNHVSPLRGKPRDRLYEQIKLAAQAYRIHRTTCEAAAAAFVCAEPSMDPMYALLVPRFHWLFSTSDDDLARVAEAFRKEGRDPLLQRVDAAIKDHSGSDWAKREARKQELDRMAILVQSLALQTLARAGSN
ncbi:MAG: hypothetical protein U1F36_11715 [Planctomycetota bacterium]